MRSSRSRFRSSSSSPRPTSRSRRRVAFLGERLGFTAAQCVAFGDGENDRDLLRWAGLGVCVANANERLRGEADWVIPSVNDDGVAQFLEQLVAARTGS